MQFRLTYRGQLPSTQKQNKVGDAKHAIRKALHPQLRDLCARNDRLAAMARSVRGEQFQPSPGPDWYMLDIQTAALADIGQKYRLKGFEFVPLIIGKVLGHCELDVLFLRREKPGSLLTKPKDEYGGDLDNRLKIFFDALRVPQSENELPRNAAPTPDEVPFYCLLEDDAQITAFRVESDTLLGDSTPGNAKDVSLVVQVTTRLTEVNAYNIRFLT